MTTTDDDIPDRAPRSDDGPDRHPSGYSTAEWWNAVIAEFSLTDVAGKGDRIQPILDLARDVAHGVARPAAPLTTFLLGAAVARGVSLDEATLRVRSLLGAAG